MDLRVAAYGTLGIRLLPEAAEQIPAVDQTTAEDGWNTFTAQSNWILSPPNFIAASCSLLDNSLIIRVYLIPHDLPGVRGQLRIRKENVTAPARRCLINLLPRYPEAVIVGQVAASGSSGPRNNASGLYEDLPSPQDRVTEASTPITRRLLDYSDVLQNIGIRSTLHRYQRRSVAAMTVMILALIMSTLNQLSDPEPSILDSRPVLTPIASFSIARTRFFRNKNRYHSDTSPRLATAPVTFISECRSQQYAKEPTDNERTTKRSRPNPAPRLLYLTSATLVVVPTNLLSQWSQEILLHCEDTLRVCILRAREPMPPAQILASEYDVSNSSHPGFTAEDQNKRRTDGPGWRACTCAEYPASPEGVSPLLQSVGKDWSSMKATSPRRSRRYDAVHQNLECRTALDCDGNSYNHLLGLSLVDSTPSIADVSPRVWTRDDSEDLTKLGNMITHFVGVPQLLANPQLVATHIKDAVEVLMQLMSSVMIRHRITDVEEEVVLPPVTQELVLLDLSPLAIKSYNALQAAIAINAVSSERKDQDYMFHPQNAKYLQLTVRICRSELMFWAVDDNYYNADEQIRNSDNLKNKIAASASPEDIQLLDDAFHHLKEAAEDPLWRALQNHEDVPYRVYDLKQSILNAWTRTAHRVEPSDESQCGLIHPDRLNKLRRLVLDRPLITEQNLILTGQKVEEEDVKLRLRYLEELKHKKGSKSSRNQDESSSRQKEIQAAKKAADPTTVKQVQQELEHVLENADTDSPISQLACTPWPSMALSQSHLAKTRFGCSASSKLNYIINEVLEQSPTEKILIFSKSELSLAHIGEALDLIGVDFLRFTTQITPRVREQFVLTFETSEKYRVFLMELKHGARGLNLITASRVIFCEPVWEADVESQAIKRCHRIGQKRPISVKTLTIRETAEQNIAARRLALKDSQEKQPKLIHDNGMRDFIANPKFLTRTPIDTPTMKVPLIKLPPSEPSMAEDCMDSYESGPSVPGQTPWFRFADDAHAAVTGPEQEATKSGGNPESHIRSVRLKLRESVPESPPRKKAKIKRGVRFADDS
ncbi:hypothetical protein B0H10DRAFT_2011949 [Mycena sp. CBHHK59/15]|nr:hypothetical protein B0H10DRAFT_2011949 [Mycena sp. CBHHK59/15]